MSVIVLYVLDSLRSDALEPYGAQSGASPHLTELAKEGIVFENAFSQSTWTRPSGASILSSTYPGLHGVNSVNDIYPRNLPTIAKELRQAGFTTIGLTAMGNIAPAFGFNQGFDDFRTLYDREDIVEREIATKAEKVGWDNHFDSPSIGIATGADINKEINKIIEKYSEDLFLFVWSIDTHDPYFHRGTTMETFTEITAKEPIWNHEIKNMTSDEERKLLRDLYQDMVYYADDKIGMLVNMLKSKGLYDETFFAVTSDHGEAFGEHGKNGHKGKPYEEQIHVPLIVKPRRSQEPPIGRTRRGEVVETIDLYPTICERFDITPKSDYIQGEDLFSRKEDGVAFVETLDMRPRYRALRTECMKYIQADPPHIRFDGVKDIMKRLLGWGRATLSGDEVYHLKEDPNETTNIIDNRDVSSLKMEIDHRVKENEVRTRTLGKTEDGKIDDETKTQLEYLGYLK